MNTDLANNTKPPARDRDVDPTLDPSFEWLFHDLRRRVLDLEAQDAPVPTGWREVFNDLMHERLLRLMAADPIYQAAERAIKKHGEDVTFEQMLAELRATKL
jgi:hypothetical protein